MESQFVSGEQIKRDYTPNSDVAAGQVVVVSNNVYFAPRPITSGTLGTLCIGGIWDCAKVTVTSGSGWSDGALLYWNDSTNELTTTAASNKKVGVAVGATADSATTGRVLSIPQAV